MEKLKGIETGMVFTLGICVVEAGQVGGLFLLSSLAGGFLFW